MPNEIWVTWIVYIGSDTAVNTYRIGAQLDYNPNKLKQEH